MRSSGGRVVALLTVVVLAACQGQPPQWSFGPDAADLPTPAPSVSVAPSPTAVPTSAPPTAAPSPIAGGWTVVKEEPCPGSRFQCTTLAVPRDHFASGGPTWEVTYGIQRATSTRKGTFVVITGGPGYSGLASAESYTDAFPAGVAEGYDIAFLDQRGIGLSHPFQCPEAATGYYGSPARPQDPAQEVAVAAAAETFVRDCLTESGADPADLPFYATRQAVEDLEAIREHLAVETIHLYGESYGTQYVQMYALSHPDRIATLYLDGPVDLTLPGPTTWAEATKSFDDVLIATLSACAADDTCGADFEGSTPLEAYDELASTLAEGPIDYDFPKADGTVEQRQYTANDLETAAAGYLYSPGDRWYLERALAAAVDGNLVPLARLTWASLALDPETLAIIPDPTYSDAMYYAVECQDYTYHLDAGTPAQRVAAYLAAARTAAIDRTRLSGVYYGDLPCIFWPNTPTDATRPAPIVDPPFPVFVMVATGDPITPVANATRLLSRLPDGYGIIKTGGPHVIFGWGEACPDEVIGTYLVNGTTPRGPLTICESTFADDYVAVAPEDDAGYADALALLSSTDDQITGTNDYGYRLDDQPLSIGCDHGGTLTYTPTETGTDLELEACEFTDGLAITGNGGIDDATGGLTLDVTIDGEALDYARDGDGDLTVTGTFRGQPVDQTG